MHAEKRTRTVVFHEWTLPSPAHHTEIDKALVAARNSRSNHGRVSGSIPSDITVSCDDQLVVIGYSVDQTRPLDVPAQRDGE